MISCSLLRYARISPMCSATAHSPFASSHILHYEQFTDGMIECIEEEIPFKLPDGWLWTRLGSITYTIQYGLSNSAEQSGTHKLLRITDIQNGKVNWDTVPFTSVSKPEAYLLEPGDIVFARTGATVGKSFLIDEIPYPAVYASYLIRIRMIENTLSKYIYLFFNSQCYWSQITDKSVGVGQPNCNGTSLKELLIPLPPINEQSKIIIGSHCAFEYINEIEYKKESLLQNISSIKSKILNLAIRGKLVPQDPNDEPASALLERIRAEKEKLIKQGKAKREKKESVIFKGDNNSYYQDLPENWKMVAFSNIAALISGRDLRPEEYNSNNLGIPYITGASNFSEGNILINRWTTSPKSISIKNDILLSCKGTVGEIAINSYEKAHIARQIMAIRVSPKLNLKYVELFFESIILEIKKSADGLIPGISRDNILNLNIPLPPLVEQDRIVKAVEITFSQLNNIANLIL